jgi:hypothetical protein
MREMKIFCSARDSEARVILADEPIDDAHAELSDLTLTCREIGVKCTGSMCPVCAEPAVNVDTA